MQTTSHAAIRMQQRSIPPLVVVLLFQFGACEPAGDGAAKFFFDKPARRKVKAYVGAMAKVLEEHMDIYAVISADAQVITVAHRLQRFSRH